VDHRRKYHSIVLVACTLSTAAAQDEPPETEGRRILEAAVQARYELRSGIFRATGSKTVKGDDTHPPLDGVPLDVFCAFDWSARKFRFDSAMPFYVQINRQLPRTREQPHLDPNAPRVEIDAFEVVRVRQARTPDYAVDWMGHGDQSLNAVLIMAPEKPFRHSDLSYPLDARAMGFLDNVSFEAGRTLDELGAVLPGQLVSHVERQADGKMRLTTPFDIIPDTDFDDSKRLIYIDVQNGHTPVRLELHEERYRRRGLDGPSQLAEVSWIVVNGVWVPRRFLSKLANITSDGKVMEQTYEYDFEWESVNEAVPDDLFTYKTFQGLPKGTPVYDVRDGRKKIETIGMPPPAALAPPSGISSRLWLVAANLIVLAILAVGAYVRFRRQRQR
jgi:hypothetical protein